MPDIPEDVLAAIHELKAAGTPLSDDLKVDLNRYRLHRSKGRPRQHDYLQKQGIDPFDPQLGCTKCVRIRGRMFEEIRSMREAM